MQKVYPRTNPTTFGASENSNGIPAPQIEEAIRESVRQNAAHIRREPEDTGQVVTDVNSLIQRVAGVSLDQLDDAIVDLRQLREFLRSEGERIQSEISGYLRLSQTAMSSTKIITDNIVFWKETTHNTARTPEKRSAATERTDFVASTPLPSPSPPAPKDLFIPPK